MEWNGMGAFVLLLASWLVSLGSWLRVVSFIYLTKGEERKGMGKGGLWKLGKAWEKWGSRDRGGAVGDGKWGV